MKDKDIIKQYRSDVTRLKNLLRNYRDHMITQMMNTMKHLEPANIIKEVDKAIKTIKDSLK